MTYIVFLLFLTYGIIFWTGNSINKKLAEAQALLKPKTFQYHTEINRVLIVQVRTHPFDLKLTFFQSITPLIAILIPFICCALTLILSLELSETTLLISMSLAWIPVINPFFSLFMVTLYRRFLCKKYLGRYLLNKFGCVLKRNKVIDTSASFELQIKY